MDLEAQMEAQIHFLEAQLVFWRPMGLCTLQGPNPLSPSVIFGDRTLASLPSAENSANSACGVPLRRQEHEADAGSSAARASSADSKPLSVSRPSRSRQATDSASTLARCSREAVRSASAALRLRASEALPQQLNASTTTATNVGPWGRHAPSNSP